MIAATASVAMECVNVWAMARLPQPSYTPLPFAPEDVAGVAFPVLGALLVFQRPRLVIGWLLCLGGLCSALNSLTVNLALLDAAREWGVPSEAIWAVAGVSWKLTILFLVVLLPLLYPDGRLPSPRWRALVWFAVAVLAADVLVMDLMGLSGQGYPTCGSRWTCSPTRR